MSLKERITVLLVLFAKIRPSLVQKEFTKPSRIALDIFWTSPWRNYVRSSVTNTEKFSSLRFSEYILFFYFPVFEFRLNLDGSSTVWFLMGLDLEISCLPVQLHISCRYLQLWYLCSGVCRFVFAREEMVRCWTSRSFSAHMLQVV